MTVDDFRELYAYNRWANRRTCSAARLVEHGDFVQDLRAGHASVRGTLVHILWGEWLWLRRWRGESPKQVFAPEDFPTIAAVEARWGEVERGQGEYLARLTGESLGDRVSYENLQGKRWEYTRARMLQHVLNHSSYHRGQVAALLRQLGKPPGATDLLMWIDEGGGAGGER